MFQFMLFTGSIIAFIIGGLVVLIGIGAIAGCAGGILIMMAGGIVSLFGIWSAISFLLPKPEGVPAGRQIVTLTKQDGKWA